jgi:F0F1-type ATP synthase membrane subunit b/b'
MDKTLQALGAILLNAVPTILLVLILHFYLKRMFFKPMEALMKQRYDATEGARKLAQESMERASARAAEHEAAIRTARAQVYQAQEQQYRKLQEDLAARLAEARHQAEARAKLARERIQGDVAQARTVLAGESEILAGKIADAVLRRSAA